MARKLIPDHGRGRYKIRDSPSSSWIRVKSSQPRRDKRAVSSSGITGFTLLLLLQTGSLIKIQNTQRSGSINPRSLLSYGAWVTSLHLLTGRRPFLYGQCFGRLQTNEDSYETRFTMESNNRSIVSVSTLQELNLCDPRSLILVRITVSKRLSSQLSPRGLRNKRPRGDGLGSKMEER